MCVMCRGGTEQGLPYRARGMLGMLGVNPYSTSIPRTSFLVCSLLPGIPVMPPPGKARESPGLMNLSNFTEAKSPL